MKRLKQCMEWNDFKYHYRKEDKLEPILTLTLYWGRKRWEQPLSLMEMVNVAKLPKEMGGKFEDYRINLIHMRSIPEEELQKMDSDLKYVLGIMKCTGSKKKYKEYIWKNREYFSKIPRSVADVIDVCTSIKNIRGRLEFTADQEDGEETADMCKALVEIEKDAEKKGIKKGMDQTRKLTRYLLTDGRQEDLLRATTDTIFMKKLLKEYEI